MTDWTDLDIDGLLPGEPLTSEKALAFYQNPIAAFEGASGAPALQYAALGTVAAGAEVKLLSDSEKTKRSTSFSTIFFVGLPHNGSVRLTLRQRAESGLSQCIVQVLKNGVLEQNWSTTSTSYISRTLDISVSPADVILVQYRGTATGTGSDVFVDQIRLGTTGGSLWPLISQFIEDISA